jgi:hypothetical protein
MTTTQTILYVGLITAAAAQLAVACLNLRLVPLLGWRATLDALPLLFREVFQVHAWFISITLAIFGVLTLRFAGVMATGGDAVATWLVTGIGVFWAIRAVLQMTYYSSSHWRGRRGRTAVNVVLLVMYGGMTAVYLAAGWMGR